MTGAGAELVQRRVLGVAARLVGRPARAQSDAGDAAWDTLLTKHVRWRPDPPQSRIDENGFAAERTLSPGLLDCDGSLNAVGPWRAQLGLIVARLGQR